MSDSPHTQAVAALDSDDRSPTARVFAACRAIVDSETTLQSVLERYASHRSRHRFHPPPAVERDIRRCCRAASEQGVDVDAAAVIESATPGDAATVRTRARRIRQSPDLSPEARGTRLTQLLAAADEAGIAVSRDDLDRFDPERETVPAAVTLTHGPNNDSSQVVSSESTPGGDTAEPEPESQIPADPAALDALLVEHGCNLVTGADVSVE